MKNILKNRKFILLVMIYILFLVSNLYLIKTIYIIDNIENIFRYLVIFVLILTFSLVTLKVFKVIFNKKQKKSIVLSIVLVVLFLLECLTYNALNKVYMSINSISSNETKYSSSLITLKDSKLDRVEKISNKKIGLLNDKNSIDNYVIPTEIINEKKLRSNNKIVEYDNIILMIQALYDKEVDAIFLNSNYPTLFSFNGFSNIKNETLILLSKSKIVKNNKNTETIVDKPFTILLMGVDSTYENIKEGSAFNGDSLLLLTLNPKTLNSTILSIPRDTYVPIDCYKDKREDKITHAASYGQNCMIKTIENFTNIKIDYYSKINFKGLVKLVDKLGGIYIDVPYSLCEQNSNRDWGKNTVFIEKGYRKINGEQALALARNRHNPNDGSDVGITMSKYCPKYKGENKNDFVRGQNQQKIIVSILDKLKEIKNINEIYSILDLLSNNLETNMSTGQILSLYNIGKTMLIDKNSKFSLDPLYLEGRGEMVYYTSFKKLLYVFHYNRDSLKDIVHAMNINLEKENPNIIKETSFSINKPYQKVTIGKGPYSKVYTINTLDNFVNQKSSVAKSWAEKNNINIVIKEVEVNKESENDIVKSQNIPYGYIVKDIKGDLIIEVGKYTPKILEEDLSKVPDFSNYTIKMANDWKNKVNDKITITIKEIKKEDSLYDSEKKGKLYKQSIEAGISIANIKEITITFFEE